jgi:hypothetical protein
VLWALRGETRDPVIGWRWSKGTHIVILIKERHDLGSRDWSPGPGITSWRCVSCVVGSIRIIAIAMRWPTRTVRSTARVSAKIRSSYTALGAIAPWEFLAKEALKLAKTAAGYTRLRTGAAGRGYAGDRWAPPIVEGDGVGGVLATSSCAGLVDRGLVTRRQLRCYRQAITGVVEEAGLASGG